MVNLIKQGVYLCNGEYREDYKSDINIEEAKKNTIAYSILNKHNTSGNMDNLKIKFDAMASHDITYVGIIQTARASGMTEFPLPYVLTNCHNSLCAVGGTINEDDHVFGLSAAKKYGGIYVPAHIAVIHQYMREMMAQCGNMILGSDSHTRYGALGTMAVGEGGPELVKQLLNKTYDIDYPEVIAVYLEGKPALGVGPQDVALAIIGAVFKNAFVKNKVMEFVGPGIKNLSVEFRNGIDVMTTETTCLSSIWATDEKVQEYYKTHGRAEAYAKLEPGSVAYYDGMVRVDLSKVQPMIALPFHPSNVYTIKELNENAEEILRNVDGISLADKIVDGKILVDQGIVAGCSGGTFENITKMAAILDGKSVGSDYFNLSVYPSSQPVYSELLKNGAAGKLMESGAVMKTAFCGPCFGAGDVPNNNGFSIRHTTRNFPSREGSKPGAGQIAAVALMDATSIAATALNGGILTPATEVYIPEFSTAYSFNGNIYGNRVYQGYGKADTSLDLKFGPNITDWPKMPQLADNMLLKFAAVIYDEVTTTDELIPSGETSSYRSNPLKLAEFTLSRKEPLYVERAKATQALNGELQNGVVPEELKKVFDQVEATEDMIKNTGLGSVVYANKPGDGSAREQAASCQKVLGGTANIAVEYATKRYRSNLINWGMLPFTIDQENSVGIENGDYVFVEGIRAAVEAGKEEIKAKLVGSKGVKEVTLYFKNLTKDERDIILAGCLINYYGKDK
ncbi:hydratase [Clostridium cellulovorans]|uniref:Aconitate hydratase domain-containing protein n=1 Tax=Clostridium cellulovorans (strain ATCC 35296 / DSM 3052 / OCM 3 / 743B) TaxID=573061 RepID=D9SW14_CLOC7|nr:hydratase [Clostridium cellulovorans]ADL51158.1 aconitate hydratase domain-containing protein [Clostridium cellulovorans 743B]